MEDCYAFRTLTKTQSITQILFLLIYVLYCVWGLTFSLGMVLDMSAGLIMAGTPPRNDTAVFISLKLLFSFSSSSLNSTDGESGPSFTINNTMFIFKQLIKKCQKENSETALCSLICRLQKPLAPMHPFYKCNEQLTTGIGTTCPLN